MPGPIEGVGRGPELVLGVDEHRTEQVGEQAVGRGLRRREVVGDGLGLAAVGEVRNKGASGVDPR